MKSDSEFFLTLKLGTDVSDMENPTLQPVGIQIGTSPNITTWTLRVNSYLCSDWQDESCSQLKLRSEVVEARPTSSHEVYFSFKSSISGLDSTHLPNNSNVSPDNIAHV